MADQLTFYTNPMSRGRIARWMLEEVGQPYETVVLDYGTTMKDAAYLAINPLGKVPAIRHVTAAGPAIVTEAAAICAYLADAFPAAGLAPDPADRADYYRWMFFSAGPVEQAVTNKALNLETAEDKSVMLGYGSYEAMVHALEAAVAGRPYIAGNRFTAADVYVGSQIGWGLMFGTLPKLAAFETYVGGLRERPAAQRASEIDDALMPAAASSSGA